MARALRGLRTVLAATLFLVAVIAGSYLLHRRPLPAPRAGPSAVVTRPAASQGTTTTVPHPPTGLAWQPLGDAVAGRPALQIAVLAGSANAPTQVAIWVDRALVRPELIPGNQSPGGANWSPVAQVPAAEQSALLAAFNSGLPFTDAHGGFYAQGRTAVALVAGAASLVIHADGTAAVGQWGRDVDMDPTVVAVRQNLVLLVDGRSPTAAVSHPALSWGSTTTKSTKVWRSAVGIDGGGNLI